MGNSPSKICLLANTHWKQFTLRRAKNPRRSLWTQAAESRPSSHSRFRLRLNNLFRATVSRRCGGSCATAAYSFIVTSSVRDCTFHQQSMAAPLRNCDSAGDAIPDLDGRVVDKPWSGNVRAGLANDLWL